MPRISAELFADNYLGKYRAYQALAYRRIEAAALIATDRAAQVALQRIRSGMQGAGLGRLGNAIGASSDMQRSGTVHRNGDDFSASGVVFIRSGSQRARGAIEAYTGTGTTDIAPKRGRWLWIATDQIPRVTQRYRMTPELYRKNGFEQKIGPLKLVKGINGWPLYVVEKGTVSAVGKTRSARAIPPSGRIGKNRREKQFIVAFVAIPFTSRAARISITAIMKTVQAELPRLFAESIERTF